MSIAGYGEDPVAQERRAAIDALRLGALDTILPDPAPSSRIQRLDGVGVSDVHYALVDEGRGFKLLRVFDVIYPDGNQR